MVKQGSGFSFFTDNISADTSESPLTARGTVIIK